MDTMALRGSNAFVTGGGSGIGRALVLELASLGVDVTVRSSNWGRFTGWKPWRQLVNLGLTIIMSAYSVLAVIFVSYNLA